MGGGLVNATFCERSVRVCIVTFSFGPVLLVDTKHSSAIASVCSAKGLTKYPASKTSHSLYGNLMWLRV